MMSETPQPTHASILETAKAHRLELIRRGIPPYGSRFQRTATTADCTGDAYVENRSVRIAGRLSACRNMGKTRFWDLRDQWGHIQLFLNDKALEGASLELAGELGIGDILGVEGDLFRTRTGEISVRVKTLTLLAKALRPLPEKYHGLKDVEARFRQRYLDLTTNAEVTALFVNRSRIIRTLRRELDDAGFLEVETPMLQPLYGGAAAKPFITHHNALDMDLYLRIAPELYLKRLLVGGLEKVYELNRNFRNEGISRRHNPEFTMLEVYEAYADYSDMMKLCERLVKSAATAAGVSGEWRLPSGAQIPLERPFHQVTLENAVRDVCHLPDTSAQTLMERAREDGLELPDETDPGVILVALFEKHVESGLIEPTFVTDFPAVVSPLARKNPGDPRWAERFELYIDGQEIGNAYSELNDPVEQHARFLEQLDRTENGDSPRGVDHDYVRALEHGMPPAGGLGIGIDRLVMMVTGSSNIREVILFPLLRPEEGA